MEKENDRKPACADCDVESAQKACLLEKGRPAKGCPTLTRAEVLEAANKEFEDPEILEFARQASIQEAECYANRQKESYVMQPTKTRIVEICEFAHKMGYKKLGLAFCVGLRKEAEIVADILDAHGFQVISAICKAGRTPKKAIGLSDQETIALSDDESMCNPVFQAEIMNDENTDFNVLLGLCVGHDSLFFKYTQAPTTVLAVKDRVTGHNPLAAVYLSGSYYRKVKHPEIL